MDDLSENEKKAYQTLELTVGEPLATIKKAFNRLTRLKHPDKNKNDPNASENYINIKEAYKLLCESKQNQKVKLQNDNHIEQLPPNKFMLQLTLEELFSGCVKEKKITRKRINENTGVVEDEEKLLQVPIKPGIMTGSKVIVEREGDHHIGEIPANVEFVICEEPHLRFTRKKVDLEYIEKVSTKETLLKEIQIQTLENKMVTLAINELITPKTVKEIPGHGFPIPNKNGERGKLIVRFEVIYEPNLPQDPPIERNLTLTLRQILEGTVEQVKLTRQIFDAHGNVEFENSTIFIDIKPGTEEGTTFPLKQKGDKRPDSIPADIHYVVNYKPHLIFKKDGLNIEYIQKITKREATISGVSCQIPTLKSEKLPLVMQEPILETATKIFESYGLPRDDNMEIRGNLIVHFEILDNDCVESSQEYKLQLSLENVLNGILKKVNVKRKIFNTEGDAELEDNIITIDIKPGVESGTRFTFYRLGDDYPGRISGNVIFIATDKPHEHFKRIGADIEYTAIISQDDFAMNSFIQIPTLESENKVKIKLDDIVNPSNSMKRLPNLGLPFPNDPTQRGDLIVRFQIEDAVLSKPKHCDLYLSAEQMLEGCKMDITINRKIIDNDGEEKTEKYVLNLNVKPGTVEGTQLIYPRVGDHLPGQIPADYIYTIKCKVKDPPIYRNIAMELESILTGFNKKLLINRKSIDIDGNENKNSVEIEIEIEPGLEAGKQFTFTEIGDQIVNRISSDIIFTVMDKPHEHFKRDGVDIEYTTQITNDQAANGLKLDIPTLENEKIQIQIDKTDFNKIVRRIPGRGLPHFGIADKRGDLVVVIDVQDKQSERDYEDAE